MPGLLASSACASVAGSLLSLSVRPFTTSSVDAPPSRLRTLRVPLRGICLAASAAGSAPVSCLSGRFPAPGSLRITTASADSLCWLPGKGSPQVRTRCLATQPPHLPPRLNRRTSLCGASSSHRVGLFMRFLFIGSSVSHSLPSPGRLPFRSWPLVVISFMFSYLGSLTGDFHPICNAPMLAAHPTMQQTDMSRALWFAWITCPAQVCC